MISRAPLPARPPAALDGGPMRITTRYFATLRELRGCASEGVGLPPGTTAKEAFTLLFPGLPLTVAYAVQQATVPGDTVLHEGDELAFLPPLGGG